MKNSKGNQYYQMIRKAMILANHHYTESENDANDSADEAYYVFLERTEDCDAVMLGIERFLHDVHQSRTMGPEAVAVDVTIPARPRDLHHDLDIGEYFNAEEYREHGVAVTNVSDQDFSDDEDLPDRRGKRVSMLNCA